MTVIFTYPARPDYGGQVPGGVVRLSSASGRHDRARRSCYSRYCWQFPQTFHKPPLILDLGFATPETGVKRPRSRIMGVYMGYTRQIAADSHDARPIPASEPAPTIWKPPRSHRWPRRDRFGNSTTAGRAGKRRGGWRGTLAVDQSARKVVTVPLEVPQSHVDLLHRPTFAHLATVRPDGAPQTQVMWFVRDGERIRMTHTKTRQKFRNFQREPRVAMSIAEPDNPYRFLEIRGSVESIVDDDAEASFYQSLQKRYARSYPIVDAAERVLVTIRPEKFIAHGEHR